MYCLKKIWFHWWPVVIALLISSIFWGYHCIYWKEGLLLKPEELIKVIGGIFAFSFGMIWKLKEEAKIEKELFDKFNARYDERFNDLLNELARNRNSEESEPQIIKINGEEKELSEIKNLLIDYFNMCGEEYLWYRKGLISEIVWEEWLRGIKSHLETKVVKATLKEDLGWKEDGDNTENHEKYYGLIKLLAKALNQK